MISANAEQVNEILDAHFKLDADLEGVDSLAIGSYGNVTVPSNLDDAAETADETTSDYEQWQYLAAGGVGGLVICFLLYLLNRCCCHCYERGQKKQPEVLQTPDLIDRIEMVEGGSAMPKESAKSSSQWKLYSSQSIDSDEELMVVKPAQNEDLQKELERMRAPSVQPGGKRTPKEGPKETAGEFYDELVQSDLIPGISKVGEGRTNDDIGGESLE